MNHAPPAGDPPSLSRIDTSVPHPARRYDYWLGGKDNFAADRESGDQIAAAFPNVRISALENRRFMHRAIGFLAGEAGIRQFLDIGTGIPTSPNVHEIAQGTAPDSRVVYVDNDPIVLVHARALLTSTADGATAYIDGDLRQPRSILDDPALISTLDLGKPVAVSLIAVLHFMLDEEDPYGIVRTLMDAVPSGSYLAVSNVTMDLMPRQAAERMGSLRTHGPFRPRTRAEFARFVEGLELVEPGIVPVTEWRPTDDPSKRVSPAEASVYCAVARKP